MPLINVLGLGSKTFSPFSKSFVRGFVEIVETIEYSRVNASSDFTISFNTVSSSFANSLEPQDLIVAYVAASVGNSNAGNKSYTPTGYTPIGSIYRGSSTTYQAVVNASYKVSDGTESSITIPGADSSSHSQTVILQIYRNVDLDNPINNYAVGAVGGTFQASAPNVSTNEKNCLITAVFSGASNNPNPYSGWFYETKGFWSAAANDSYDSMIGVGAYDFDQVGTTDHDNVSVGHLDGPTSTQPGYSSSMLAIAFTPAYL